MARDPEFDARARIAAFAFLERLTTRLGDDLPYRELQVGLQFEGLRLPLIGQTGIFKPAALAFPISIMTAAERSGRDRPYEDEWIGDTLLYKYRGTDPNKWDNVAVRRALEANVPMVHFQGVAPGWYTPSWPVYVTGDNPTTLTFTVDAVARGESGDVLAELPRGYAHRLTKTRLHQARFRQRVLVAYREACTICRLRRRELLDAAHIVQDVRERGLPLVSNGLSMCKLHHAAFDRNMLGIRPDLVVEIRADVLADEDGPMLIHGLQGFQGSEIIVPHKLEWRPDRDFLNERYEEFRSAS
jgi:putative restriction endonuclease